MDAFGESFGERYIKHSEIHGIKRERDDDETGIPEVDSGPSPQRLRTTGPDPVATAPLPAMNPPIIRFSEHNNPLALGVPVSQQLLRNRTAEPMGVAKCDERLEVGDGNVNLNFAVADEEVAINQAEAKTQLIDESARPIASIPRDEDSDSEDEDVKFPIMEETEEAEETAAIEQNTASEEAKAAAVQEAKSEKYRKKMERFYNSIAQDAGEVVETIEKDTLVPVPERIQWDKDPELLCCYNWQASDDGTNTIYVPGEPMKWQPPSLPHTLARDSGLHPIDYNYARQPKTPYTPFFHALEVMAPGYRLNDVDVLAERNSLNLLLDIARGKCSTGPFRLNIHTVYDTLIISRQEFHWWSNRGVTQDSYGYNFERDFTTLASKGMEDATNHYRAIRYEMGPLNIVCRYEADAYDDGVILDDPLQIGPGSVSVGIPKRPYTNCWAPIQVLQRGRVVPCAQVVELKTHNQNHKKNARLKCEDQLWFARTSTLYDGRYQKGTGVVSDIVKEDTAERLKAWEQDHQESLQKLVGLLNHLRNVVRRERRPNHALVLVGNKNEPIVLRTMEKRQTVVDRDMREKFWPRRMSGYSSRSVGGGRGTFNGSHDDFATRSDHGPSTPGQGRGGIPPWRAGYHATSDCDRYRPRTNRERYDARDSDGRESQYGRLRRSSPVYDPY